MCIIGHCKGGMRDHRTGGIEKLLNEEKNIIPRLLKNEQLIKQPQQSGDSKSQAKLRGQQSLWEGRQFS